MPGPADNLQLPQTAGGFFGKDVIGYEGARRAGKEVNPFPAIPGNVDPLVIQKLLMAMYGPDYRDILAGRGQDLAGLPGEDKMPPPDRYDPVGAADALIRKDL